MWPPTLYQISVPTAYCDPRREHIAVMLKMAMDVMTEIARCGLPSQEASETRLFTASDALANSVQKLVHFHNVPQLTWGDWYAIDDEMDYISKRWVDLFLPVDADLVEWCENNPPKPVDEGEERQRIRERLRVWGDKHFPVVQTIDNAILEAI